MEISENTDQSLRWFVVLVHGIISERDEIGWYTRFIIVSEGMDDAQQLLDEYGRFIGLEKIMVDEWKQEEPAYSGEKRGIRQDGGWIHYAPGNSEQEACSYHTMSWWYKLYTKLTHGIQLWRFNRLNR